LFDVREAANRESLVLFLTLYFTIKKHDIRGLVVVLMDLPSVVALKQIVRNFIDKR
jgi:chemotaxis protein CheC